MCENQKPNSKQDKKLFYDSISREWDSFMNQYDVQRRLEVFFDLFLADEPLGNRSLLDAGCGTGLFSKWAKDRKAVVTSLDIGQNLVARVEATYHTHGVVGDILNLPFEERTFDVVVSSEAIEHTADPKKAIFELARVLKKDGLLVLSCPNYFWYWSCWLATRLKWRPYGGVENWPTWWELRLWLKKAGLVVEQMRGIHLFPFVLQPLNPLLRRLDGLGKWLGPFYVNMAVCARKP